jgi:hypothetical protein
MNVIHFKMSRIVCYKTVGRFANNLFQYFASQIIRKLFDYNEVKISQYNPGNCLYIDNAKFKEICELYMQGKSYNISGFQNIYMDGFFQRSEIYLHYKDYIMSLFTESNTHKINESFSIRDIVLYNTKHIIPTENDLVIHLRLDDFRLTKEVFEPNELIDILKTISFKNLYIICDTVKQQWEQDYINNFKEFNPIILSGNILDDFKLMTTCRRLLISASTYSWMASYLNMNLTELYIPYNRRHGDDQNLTEPNNGVVKIYRDIKYMNF